MRTRRLPSTRLYARDQVDVTSNGSEFDHRGQWHKFIEGTIWKYKARIFEKSLMWNDHMRRNKFSSTWHWHITLDPSWHNCHTQFRRLHSLGKSTWSLLKCTNNATTADEVQNEDPSECLEVRFWLSLVMIEPTYPLWCGYVPSFPTSKHVKVTWVIIRACFRCNTFLTISAWGPVEAQILVMIRDICNRFNFNSVKLWRFHWWYFRLQD